MKKTMTGQIKISIGLGSGQDAIKLREDLRDAAERLGYSDGQVSREARMIREMVSWVLQRGVWERGKGLVGLQGPEPEEANGHV